MKLVDGELDMEALVSTLAESLGEEVAEKALSIFEICDSALAGKKKQRKTHF
jgi:hypothetical protein